MRSVEPSAPRREELREPGSEERLEGLGVAEESAHADQPVPPERVDLVVVLLQVARVVGEAFDAMQVHPPLDAPQQRLALVGGEVVAAAHADQGEDPLHLAGGDLGRSRCCARGTPALRAYASRRAGISAIGSTKSVACAAIALAGMPSNSAVSGACTRERPDSARIAARPSVPSVPVPESTMPTARRA